MTTPGRHKMTHRAVESVLTSLALFLDDSCSPHNKINVFSSTSKLYFFLLKITTSLQMALAYFGDVEPSCGQFPGQAGSCSQDPWNEAGGSLRLSLSPALCLWPDLVLQSVTVCHTCVSSELMSHGRAGALGVPHPTPLTGCPPHSGRPNLLTSQASAPGPRAL